VDALFATVQPNINAVPTAHVFDGINLVNLGFVPAFGTTVSYGQQLWLGFGDTIDFVVAPNGSGGQKTTEVSATITQIPEPTTLALIGIGLAGLSFSRGRRRRI